LLAEIDILGKELLLFQGLVDNNLELFEVDRLGNIVEGPLFHGTDSGLSRSETGDHNDLRRGRQASGMLQDFNTAFVRQKQIGYNQLKRFPLHNRQRFFTGCRNGNGISSRLEQQSQCLST